MKIVRKLMVCLTVVLTLAVLLSVPVLAADSPDVGVASVTGIDPSVTITSRSLYTPAEVERLDSVLAPKASQHVDYVFDITPSVTLPTGQYVISVPVAGLTGTVVMFHEVGGTWVELPTSYANGVVTATTTSFSRFAVTSGNDVDNSANNTSTTTTTTAATSPYTNGGEANNAVLIAVLAIGAVGAFGAFRKAAKKEDR